MRNLKTYENFKRDVFYRAEPEFLGNDIDFKPEGYYEAISDNNSPIFAFDEHRVSDIPELCASKIIGGCVMGSFSMTHSDEYYIYQIDDEPDKDISHWAGEDFEYLEEVRYRHPVKGIYIGKVTLSDYQKNLFESFYKLFEYKEIDDEGESEEWNEKYGKYWDDIEDGKLSKEIKNIKTK